MERWSALYTSHKTQKRKIWHDGEITYNAAKRRLVLHAVQEGQRSSAAHSGKALNNTFMKPSAWCDAVTEGELEIDRFLVTLE